MCSRARRRPCSSCSCCCSRTRRCWACAPRPCALISRHLWLIDEEFRQNPRHHRLFLEILRAPVGVTHELRRMNNYGVLGRYIPAFGRIVGRMQYDLFHAYTVDAHTLFVVSNLRRLAMPKYDARAAHAVRHHAAAAEAGDRLPRGAVPRHRQGPRRRPLRARRGRRRGVLPRAGTVALRRAPGRLAGAQPPGAVGHRAEEGHRRPEGHQRIRAPRRRRDAPRLPVRADLRRRARHQPEAVELLEGLAVPGILRACARGAAPRPGEPDRPGRADAREPGRRARAAGRAERRRPRTSSASGRRCRRPTSCATRPRRSPGTRGCSRGAIPATTSRWWRWSRAASAAPLRC